MFAGPSIDFTRVSQATGRDPTITQGLTPGAWAGAEFRIPAHRRFFVSALAAYHLAGSLGAGPVTVTRVDGVAITTIPRFTVRPGIAVIGVGVGMNL